MKETDADGMYMDRCLELARKGLGAVAPNPMVGSLLVAGGKIIGEGYHREFGGPHAEVNAIASVRQRELLSSATLYVNLEPCIHYGKTPPCAELILEKGIPRVIVGTRDPNREVSGRGISLLREHGVSVSLGTRKEACGELNRRFFCQHVNHRPYIILKWAETRDGFLDRIRKPETHGNINWITGSRERQLVHKWRSEEQAILVGTRTAFMDDPALTVRDWSGRQPLRLVIDRRGELPGSLKLLDGKHPTVLFSERNAKPLRNVRIVNVSPAADMLDEILSYLYENQIQSLMVEGGLATLQGFIQRNLWDEARVFTGEQLFGNGIRAPELPVGATEKHLMESSLLGIYRNATNKLPVE